MSAFNLHLARETNNLVEVAAMEIFANGKQLDHALAVLRQRDIKIVVGFFSGSEAGRVLCKAIREGLTTSEHVWILPAYFDPGWWHGTACSNNEMRTALQSTLFISPTNYPPFTQSNRV